MMVREAEHLLMMSWETRSLILMETIHNVLKYRGYYYDAETGFYYVSSRYYDPVIGRFINADDINILFVDQGNLLQYNLYTYCWNNPVNMLDITGESAEMALTTWTAGMSWLVVVDGPLPIGDLIYSVGVTVLAVKVLTTGCNMVNGIAIDVDIEDNISFSKPKVKSKSD